LARLLPGPLPRRLPCPQTVRSWLLRLGLFVLQRFVRARPDWAFILDHTIQIGTQKCLLILGVPLGRLFRPLNDPKRPEAVTAALRHQDVVVLELRVLASCPGEEVAASLSQLARRVGTPVQVVSDHGAEIARGVRLFRQECPEVVDTYDVTHRLALLLKGELERDPRWLSFVSQCTATMQALQQTAGAFLRPPAPRTRARYLNLERHLDWALHVLAWSEQAGEEELAGLLGRGAGEARAWLDEKLGWLRERREEVQQYAWLREVITRTQEEVKVGGLDSQTAERVWRRLGPEVLGAPRWQPLLTKLRAYLEEEGGKVPAGQTWLGCSDVIESLFGQYKWLLEKSGSAEVGSSALLLPLLTVEVTPALVSEGLQAVGVETLRDWQQEQLGRSTLSKVRQMRQAYDRRQAQQQAGPPTEHAGGKGSGPESTDSA
jgi:hypothetical protein